MEALLHREFAPTLVLNTKEYFRGDDAFPQDVAAAFARLLPRQLEIQFQERRRSETRYGAEDDAPFKKRRLELELAKQELQHREAETRAKEAETRASLMEAEAALTAAEMRAKAMVILAKAEAQVARIRQEA